MKFKILIAMISSLTCLAVCEPVAAVETDGRVNFEVDKDMEIKPVQPGTKTPIYKLDGDSGVQINSETAGFVRLLQAPNFHFGTVELDYTHSEIQECALVNQGDLEPNGKVREWHNPFVQVADYTDGTAPWELNVRLVSQFQEESSGHVLNGTKIIFADGNVLSDTPNDFEPGASHLDKWEATIATGNSHQFLTSSALSKGGQYEIHGQIWSWVFGDVVPPTSGVDGDVTDASGLVNKLTEDSTLRDLEVVLSVPRSARARVNVDYKAEFMWTLTFAVPTDYVEP
ncbi:MAG: WxL domain-containing protein [Lactobacillales bacterium]|jgi:hypothetical protein|nr:WxL domain-containing protein [Lactobacillales bacterium]